MISDHAALTVIVSGCALLAMDWPVLSGVWLALFTTAVIITAIDEDIVADLMDRQREAT